MRLTIICAIVLGTFALSAIAQEPTQLMNLLKNPTFEFHAFANHRDGKAVSFESNSVAFWSTDAWGDIIVRREGHVARDIRPAFSTKNMVSGPRRAYQPPCLCPPGGAQRTARKHQAAEDRQRGRRVVAQGLRLLR